MLTEAALRQLPELPKEARSAARAPVLDRKVHAVHAAYSIAGLSIPDKPWQRLVLTCARERELHHIHRCTQSMTQPLAPARCGLCGRKRGAHVHAREQGCCAGASSPADPAQSKTKICLRKSCKHVGRCMHASAEDSAEPSKEKGAHHSKLGTDREDAIPGEPSQSAVLQALKPLLSQSRPQLCCVALCSCARCSILCHLQTHRLTLHDGGTVCQWWV